MITAVLILALIVIIHEFGHFIAARFFGMKVDVFSIGFGPAILKWQGEKTAYQLSLVPFGGYVKIRGFMNQDNGDSEVNSFNSHPKWKRAVVFAAGPGANLFSALAGAILAFWLYGYRPDPESDLQKLLLIQAVEQGTTTTSWAVTETAKALASVAKVEPGSSKNLSGPVGIVATTKEVQSLLGIEGVAIMAFLISIGLALVNLLPIPVLDGGHLAILGTEALMGRDISLELKNSIYIVGFLLILSIFIYTTYNDIEKIFSK